MSAWEFFPEAKYDSVKDFQDGKAIVELNNKYGFIDKTGKEIVPLIYDYVEDFNEGFARVKINDKYGIVGTEALMTPTPIPVTTISPSLIDKETILPSTTSISSPIQYDTIRSAKTKEEIKAGVRKELSELTTEQKQSEDTKEEAVALTELAISKASTAEIKASTSQVQINPQALTSEVKDATQEKKFADVILKTYGIEKNREIKTEVKVDIINSKDNISVEIPKDVINTVKAVDKLTISTGEVAVSLDAKTLGNQMGSSKKIVVDIKNKATVLSATTTKPVVKPTPKPISKSVNKVTPKPLLKTTPKPVAKPTPKPKAKPIVSVKTYTIKFKDDKGKEIKNLKEKVSISLPNQNKETDYSCVIKVDGNARMEIGGKYNKITNKIEIKSKNPGTYYVVQNKKSFADLAKKDTQIRKAIEILAAKGIISAKNGDRFNPDQLITRYDFTRLMVKALYSSNIDYKISYKDVPVKSSYYSYVASGVKEKIISGYSDNTFRGQKDIKRGEVVIINASVLNNRAGFFYPKDVEKYLNFKDKSKIPANIKKAVALVSREGIIPKRSDGMLNQDKACTRQEAAMMVYRLFTKV